MTENQNPEQKARDSFDAHGGLGMVYQLFGERMNGLLDELN